MLILPQRRLVADLMLWCKIINNEIDCTNLVEHMGLKAIPTLTPKPRLFYEPRTINNYAKYAVMINVLSSLHNCTPHNTNAFSHMQIYTPHTHCFLWYHQLVQFYYVFISIGVYSISFLFTFYLVTAFSTIYTLFIISL